MGSKGGIFNLVVRDERLDRFFTASDVLRDRLNRIRLLRKQKGMLNIQPTIGDVEATHHMHFHASYRPYVAVASEYSPVKGTGDGSSLVGASGGSLQFAFPPGGHFTSDMGLNVRFPALGTLTPTGTSPRYRYCAYPGIRLVKSAEIRSNEIQVANYTRDDVVEWAKFFVTADQQTGFDRCMGQQELKEADYYNVNDTTGVTFYRDGAQTPKHYQPPLELFIPLQFWLCASPGNALVNDLIPNTQRVVSINLGALGELVQALDPTTFAPIKLPITNIAISAVLYVNNFYVNPEIHDIFSKRIGFQMIRINQRFSTTLTAPSEKVLMSSLKFPTEYLMVGIRDRANAADFDKWWLNGRPKVRTDATKLYVPVMKWNPDLEICELVCREAQDVISLEPIVDRLGVIAHGITIYPSLPTLVYNAYIPNRYAVSQTTAVISPKDFSSMFVSFCLKPGAAELSGYYNLSAGRELYLAIEGSTISIDAPANLFVSASTINFLVRKGDSVALRYSV